jgi:ribonuclease HII
MAAPRCPNLAHAGSTVSRAGWYGLFAYDRAHGRLVAGCDEAGRACFAGPLVAAAVLFDYDRLDQDLLAGLNDSKKLTPALREALYGRVLGCAARVAVVLRASRSIDVHGLQHMNLDALHRSLVGVAEPGCVLIADGDGFKLPPVGAVEPLNLVRGDSTSAAVAAASIVAKVTRDRLMSRAAERWPGYGFEHHKGYGTRQHREAIARLGPCPLHRRSCRGVAEARAASAQPSAAPATRARDTSAASPSEKKPSGAKKSKKAKSPLRVALEAGDDKALADLLLEKVTLSDQSWWDHAVAKVGEEDALRRQKESREARIKRILLGDGES